MDHTHSDPGQSTVDVAEVKAAASGKWPWILQRLCNLSAEQLDGKGHPCPACGGTDRFSAFKDFSQTGGLLCRKCHDKKNSDGFASVMWLNKVTFPEALRLVADELNVGPKPTAKQNKPRREVATYDYCDASGTLRYQVVRYKPKDFRQRKPDGPDRWVWSVKGEELLPYRLPDILAADPSQWLAVVEGEKDADNLWSIGWPATCNPMGVGKWRDAFSEQLKGRRVVVIPDKDGPGQKHGEKVTTSLLKHGITCRVIEVPTGKDVSDYLAAGGTRESLLALVENAADCEAVANVKPLSQSHENRATISRRDAVIESTDPTGVIPSILRDFGRTELANAARFVRDHSADVRFVSQWGKWIVWTGERWRVDDAGDVHELGKKTAVSLWVELAAIMQKHGADESGAYNKAATFCRASSSAKGIENMLRLASSDRQVLVSFDELDSDPFALNVLNGAIDLRTGELRPHDRDAMFTQLAPVAFDKTARCPTWDAFLARIMQHAPACVPYLQQLVGYWLTGSTREHILPILHGPGANGKSVFLTAVLDLLGPDYSMQATPDMLLASHSDRHPTALADLFRKRFVAAVETGSGRSLNEALVKSLTGGDKVRARRMKEDFWEFAPTHKLAVGTNHRPRVTGTDNGIWRRLRLLPFTATIQPHEQDKTLPEKLHAEREGILAWAVRGAVEWFHAGLTAPPEVVAATDGYRDDSDIIGRALTDVTTPAPDSIVEATVLLRAVNEWLSQNGERETNANRLRDALADRNCEKTRTNVGRSAYRGVRLAGSF